MTGKSKNSEAEAMLSFAEEMFYNPKTIKDLALAHAMQDKINKVLKTIYGMLLFDRLTLNRDIDFRILPILLETDSNAFHNSTIMGDNENV